MYNKTRKIPVPMSRNINDVSGWYPLQQSLVIGSYVKMLVHEVPSDRCTITQERFQYQGVGILVTFRAYTLYNSTSNGTGICLLLSYCCCCTVGYVHYTSIIDACFPCRCRRLRNTSTNSDQIFYQQPYGVNFNLCSFFGLVPCLL